MRLYQLRWRYDFPDREPIRGVWSPSAKEGAAAKISREGLRYAMVEARDLRREKTFVMYTCEGQDFVLFQWIATLHVQQGVMNSRAVTQVDGLRIIARNEIIECMVNGDVNIKPITTPDFNFKSLKV